MNESPTQPTLPDPADDSPTTPAIAEDIFCPKCTYNLRGLTNDRCPECGLDIAHVREGESHIPWVHRKEIGRIRAYWKTVWIVLFHTKRFGLETTSSVDRKAARRFRLATVLLAYLPIAVLTAVWMLTAPNSYQVVLEVGGYGLIAAIHLAVASCIAATSAMPYYALRHRDLPLATQHRAAVLSEYACAPLAAILLPAIACGIGMYLKPTQPAIFSPTKFAQAPASNDVAYYLIALGLLAAILTALAFNLHRIVSYSVKDARPVWWITLKTVGLWLIAGVLTLVGIPLAYLFLAAVFFSLF